MNFGRPLGVGRDEHRDGVHEADAGVEARLGVVLLRLLGPDRQVAHEHVGAGVAQRLGHVDRLGRRLLDGLAVVLAEAVERRAALHLDAELADVGERMVLFWPAKIALPRSSPTLAASTSNAATNSTSRDVVAAEHDVHEPGHVVVGVGVAVVLDALDEAAGAVADSGDGDTDANRGLMSCGRSFL